MLFSFLDTQQHTHNACILRVVPSSYRVVYLAPSLLQAFLNDEVRATFNLRLLAEALCRDSRVSAVPVRLRETASQRANWQAFTTLLMGAEPFYTSYWCARFSLPYLIPA